MILTETSLYRLVFGKHSLVFLTDDCSTIIDLVFEKLKSEAHSYFYSSTDLDCRVDGYFICSSISRRSITVVSVNKKRNNKHDQPTLAILSSQDKELLAQYILDLLTA